MTDAGFVEPWPGVELPAAWRPGEGTTYDAEAADRGVRFFSRHCRHTKGEFAGRLFALEPWQERRIVRPMFGLMRPDGTRRIRTVFVGIPRKNGKSTLASGVALKALYADGEPGAEVYSAAVDREQARLVYSSAETMVESSPELAARSRIFRGNNARIVNLRTRGTYRVIPGDAKRAHGFNSHCVVGDELHVWPGELEGSLLEALITSTGSRRQPLIFWITTAGYDSKSICGREWARAAAIRDGALEDPSYLPVIYETARDAPWQDPDVWRAANPNLGVSVSFDSMAEAAARAKESPAEENSFKRLRLNVWTEQRTRWIPLEAWDACRDPELRLEDFAGKPCSAGLDLSSRDDTTAFVLAFDLPDGRVAIFPRFWVPLENAERRERLERIPYRAYRDRGLVELTPGSAIDYRRVLADIHDLGQRFDLGIVGFDPWNAELMRQDLEAGGIRTVEFRQGWRSMGEPTALFGRLWRERQLAHDGHALLRFQASATAVLEDPAGNLKPAKDRSGDRIDGVVASIMAVWLLRAHAALGAGEILD